LGDRNVAKRIKKFDRQLQFFSKELAHVRRACGSTTKEQSLRRASVLLHTVVTDRAHHFGVKPGHGAAHQFGNARHLRIGEFGMRPVETDKPIALFSKVCRREWLAKFLGDRGRHGTSANWNAARKELLRFDEEEICGAGTDIDEQRTTA